jgi:hypothetical protein
LQHDRVASYEVLGLVPADELGVGAQAGDDEEGIVQAVAAGFEDPGFEIGEVLQGVVGRFGRGGAAFNFFVQEEVADRAVEQEVAEVVADGKVDLVGIVSDELSGK